MRNISFMLTQPQFRARTKTVTRRFGWWFANVGDVFMGVEQCQGLGRGGKIVPMGPIEVVSTLRERPDAILTYANPQAELALEGFPHMGPEAFVDMLIKANWKKRHEDVNRIEYRYLDKLL